MLIEILVAGVCLQNRAYVTRDGCPSALQAYYLATPELARLVKRQERQLRATPYGDMVISYGVLPVYTVFVTQRATLPLTANFSLVANAKNENLVLEFAIPF